MEPIGWVALLSLLFGGYHLSQDDKSTVVIEEIIVQQDDQLVSQTPVYKRGRYYNTGQGYYVSNLSPEEEKIDGCDTPILTADLSAPRKQNELMSIDTVQIQCEK